jgi:hypothetical protein
VNQKNSDEVSGWMMEAGGWKFFTVNNQPFRFLINSFRTFFSKPIRKEHGLYCGAGKSSRICKA